MAEGLCLSQQLDVYDEILEAAEKMNVDVFHEDFAGGI